MRAWSVPVLAALCQLVAPQMLNADQEPPRQGEWFRTSDVCLACHNNLTTRTGADISIGSDWRGSMMANSARDPYWQAAVRREIIDHPSARAQIEDICSTCHMPITRFNAHAAGRKGEVFTHSECFRLAHGRRGAGWRHVHSLPSDTGGQAGHAAKLHGRVRDR